MKTRDELFRIWYDAREGTKSEGFAYDVWCAAWEAKTEYDDEVSTAFDGYFPSIRGNK